MICIFIKTWKNDLEWVNYAIKSIKKYFKGDYELVVVADEDCPGDFQHKVPVHHNGYIQQQIIKLRAHYYTQQEKILYIDSDTVFTRPCSIEDFETDGKLEMFMRPYHLAGKAICWQAPTRKYVGFKPTHEYMCRFPICHYRQTLVDIEARYPWLIEHLMVLEDRAFSEFNFMGAFAHRMCTERYEWVDVTEYTVEPAYVKQNWSWGGISPEIRAELEEITK